MGTSRTNECSAGKDGSKNSEIDDGVVFSKWPRFFRKTALRIEEHPPYIIFGSSFSTASTPYLYPESAPHWEPFEHRFFNRETVFAQTFGEECAGLFSSTFFFNE